MEYSNVKWVPWTGSLPRHAVSIKNYEGRIDYVARHGGQAGFYTPDKGSYCHYAWADKEIKASQFDILVNEGVKDLVWKGGSYGSVPNDSVRSGPDTYVGRNKYGLGKVDVKNTAFFLPWEGKEHWYKWYEVLTYGN